MHFIPQVLIVANALRAGFQHQVSGIDPKNNPPPEIGKAYDTLRNAIEEIDGAEGKAFTYLKQIEQNLFLLNQATEFQGIEIDTPPNDPPQNPTDFLIVAATALLKAIEKYNPNWRNEITGYGKNEHNSAP
jgi:hypothetical protein